MTEKTPPPPTVWPTLRSHNALALIDWLESVLGFQRTLVVEDDGLVEHAQLSWPEGGGIMLGSVRESPWDIEPGRCGSYIVTDHADEIYARVQAAGATIVQPLEDKDHDRRDFTVADPDGNLWNLGAYRGEPNF